MADLPYLLTTKRVRKLFDKIKKAAVPTRFTYEFLKKLGFTSSNDRAFVSMLKKLGFLDQSGVPTERYQNYRHRGGKVLALSITELYSELYTINQNIHEENRDTIKGVISRVTGREEKYVDLMTSTFQSLCDLADFTILEEEVLSEENSQDEVNEETLNTITQQKEAEIPKVSTDQLGFRYNIELHLPATSDISVYNAIFKSLKEHLID